MPMDREQDAHAASQLARLAAEFDRWCQEHRDALAAEERLHALGCPEAASRAAGAAAHAILQQEDILVQLAGLTPEDVEGFGLVARILVTATDHGWLGDLDNATGRVCRGMLAGLAACALHPARKE